jgi:hypothetical protein
MSECYYEMMAASPEDLLEQALMYEEAGDIYLMTVYLNRAAKREIEWLAQGMQRIDDVPSFRDWANDTYDLTF